MENEIIKQSGNNKGKIDYFKSLNSLKKLLKNVAQVIKKIYSADNVNIVLFDAKKNLLIPVVSLGKKNKTLRKNHKVGEGITGCVFETEKANVLPNTLSVPISYQSETIGVITINRAGKEKFKKGNLKLINHFNHHIEQIISTLEENKIQKDKEKIHEALHKLSNKLTNTCTVDTLYKKIKSFLTNNFPYLLSGFFIAKNGKFLEFENGINWGITPGTHFKITNKTFIGWVAKNKSELMIENIAMDKRKFIGNKNITSIYAYPLLTGKKTIGVIVHGIKQQTKWNKNDLTVLRNLNRIISQALSNILYANKINNYSIKIKNLNEFINSIIEGFPSGIITIDKRGNITLINKKAQEILGFSENNAKSITIQQLFDYKHATVNPLLETITKSKPQTRIETDIVEKDGKKVPIGISTSPLKNDSGEVIGAIGIMRELTKIKEEEEGLRREDRLVALGEMAAGMAHEIRNPLAGIKTGVEYLGRFIDEENKSSVNLIIKEIARLNRIVTDMTLYANRPPIKLDEIDIEEIINVSLAFLRNEIEERGIEIIKGFDENIPDVALDSDQIREVFDNTFLNAIQATKENGKIIITTDFHEQEDKFEVRITDNGTGISNEDKERIFNPFFTTKKGGTGLGLSICQRIISEHKGDIIVISKQEKGTTVRIVLPIKPEF